MKIWKKFLTSILAAVMIVSLSCGSVQAKENYTYTVSFLAGAQGTFGSTDGLSVEGDNAVITQTADKIVITGLAAGDVVSFNAQSAVALDATSKHYVQGVRLGGRDNDTVSDSVFTVDADQDYVVAYGIKGNLTKYTVNYQDRSGNTLAASDTFYGNVGDKPVVAYRYINGYVPLVLGFTKTLSENEAENVFTFVYEKVTAGTIVQPGTGTTPGGDQSGNEPGGTTPGNDQSGDDEPGSNEPGSDEPGSNEPGSDDPGTDEPGTGEPEESSPIVDLDDEEVPLGNVDADGDGLSKLPVLGMIAIIIIALAALVNLIFLIKRRGAKR